MRVLIAFALLASVVCAAPDTQPAGKPWIGIITQDYTSDSNPKCGAAVSSVEPDSPAAKIGVSVGDLVTMWGGKKIKSKADLEAAIQTSAVGKKYAFGVIRNIDGKNRFAEFPITIVEKVPEVPATPVEAAKKDAFAEAISQHRILKGMSEEQVAKSMDMSKHTVDRGPLGTQGAFMSNRTVTDDADGRHVISWLVRYNGFSAVQHINYPIVRRVSVSFLNGIVVDLVDEKYDF